MSDRPLSRGRQAAVDPAPSMLGRLWASAGLLLGLRGHDLRAAATLLRMTPGRGLPQRLARFLAWSWNQAWQRIPDGLAAVDYPRRVDRTPYWLAAGNPLANHPWAAQPGARLPAEADVVVIGAGFTGAALAYHWGRTATDGHMVVLDMHDPATGASGRSGGEVVMGRYYALVVKKLLAALPAARPDLVPADRERLARQFAAVYCRAAYANAELVRETIAREGIDCDYRRLGWVCGTSAADQENLAEAVRLGEESGYDDWSRLPAAEAAARTGARIDLPAACSRGAALFHPARYVFGLLDRGLASGRVSLFCRTPVVGVDREGDGYRVRTPRGVIAARHVVHATESYAAGLVPALRGRLEPRQTQAAFAAAAADTVAADRSVFSTTTAYFVPHGGGVVCGSDETPLSHRQAGRNRPSRFITGYVLGEMRRWFGPRRLRVTHEWSGTAGFTADEYPIVGPVDGHRQQIIAGMCGSGSGVSFNAARCLVNRILGRAAEEDHYPPEYFAPGRVIDPRRHRWPDIQRPDEGFTTRPASLETVA